MLAGIVARFCARREVNAERLEALSFPFFDFAI
jgi:hypothetical protein